MAEQDFNGEFLPERPDWADERAKAWLETVELDDPADIASLATLLVETSERAITMAQLAQLAEVRRVVMHVFAPGDESWLELRDRLLSRLDVRGEGG